jgi:hypothetical protein
VKLVKFCPDHWLGLFSFSICLVRCKFVSSFPASFLVNSTRGKDVLSVEGESHILISRSSGDSCNVM